MTGTDLVLPSFDTKVFGIEDAFVVGDGDEIAELREVDDREVRRERRRDSDADLICDTRL